MAFETRRKLTFGDADPSGAAYFPSYFHLMVGVVEEFFAHLGHPWADLARDRQIITPTAHLEAHFLRPGFPGDDLTFRVAVKRATPALVDLHHEIRRGEDLLWAADHTLAAASTKTRRGTLWPEPLRDAFLRLALQDAGD